MRLSVIIPTLDKVSLLRRTLAALQAQVVAPAVDWEVVVVDDGSTDDTPAFLAAEAARGPLRLRVVSPGRNVGRARARNLGAKAAVGEFLLFLDDDIVAPPGLLAAHLALLERNPGAGTIGYAVTDPELVDGPHFHYLDSRGAARLPEGPAPARFFVTQNAAVPRAAFLSVGGFDEEFSAYGFEDMEVAFRLEDQAGIRFMALTAPVPLHVHHHTAEQYFAKKVECGRHSLPHLARLHPERLPQMRLHHVGCPGSRDQGGVAGAVLRRLAVSAFGRGLARRLCRWPVHERHRPRFRTLYFRLMNLAVLFAFRQGVIEAGAKDRQTDASGLS